MRREINTRKREERIAFRLVGEERERAERLAERLFEGNMSLLGRIALREYVERKECELAESEAVA